MPFEHQDPWMQQSTQAIMQNKNPDDVVRALIETRNIGILSDDDEPNQEYFMAIGQHQGPSSIVNALKKLQKLVKKSDRMQILYGFGKQDTWNPMDIIAHPYPDILVNTLIEMNKIDWFRGTSPEYENIRAMIVEHLREHPNSKDIIQALKYGTKSGLLWGQHAKEHRKAIVQHHSPIEMVSILVSLRKMGRQSASLEEDDMSFAMRYPNPIDADIAHCNARKASSLSGSKRKREEHILEQPPCSIAYDAFKKAIRAAKKAHLLCEMTEQANTETIKQHFNQHPNSFQIVEALEYATAATLLFGEDEIANRKAIASHPKPRSVVFGLSLAQEQGLLGNNPNAAANRQAIASHANPTAVANTLKSIKSYDYHSEEAGLRREDNEIILSHLDPFTLWLALDKAQQTRLLSRADSIVSKTDIINHEDPMQLINTLIMARDAGLLVGHHAHANKKAILECSSLASLSDIFTKEKKINGENLNQENFDIVSRHSNPELVFDLIVHAKNIGLLSGHLGQANRERIGASQNISLCVIDLLKRLSKLNLLSATYSTSPKNFWAVLTHQNPEVLLFIINLVTQAGLLKKSRTTKNTVSTNQARIDQLMMHSNILCTPNLAETWEQIPGALFTVAIWDRLMLICRANQVNPTAGQVHVGHYINQAFPMLYNPEPITPSFNSGQSTHVTSVHESLAQSAIALKNRYTRTLQDSNRSNIILKTIHNWVHDLGGKYEVQQRALQLLTSSRSEAFIEKRSQLTIKQLLVLVWEAINDDSIRGDDLQQNLTATENAQALFLDGLLEIQRAYNLSEENKDMGGNDQACCLPGAFNKLLEKLVGVHPDVYLHYITNQAAVLKITPLIKEAINQYLNNTQDLGNLSVGALKQAVLPDVRARLYFEYGSTVFKTLTQDHDTFEDLEASDKYDLFKHVLNDDANHSETLESIIIGKLLEENNELDTLLELLLEKEKNKKPSCCFEESPNKPASPRITSLSFFSNSDRNDGSILEPIENPMLFSNNFK